MSDRWRSIVLGAVAAAVLMGIAAWTFDIASRDWRYQLAGLAEPFLGQPTPGFTIAIGLVASLALAAVVAGARVLNRRRRQRAGEERTASSPARLRWWLPLVAGWVGYALGGLVVLASGGPREYAGTLEFDFGAPIRASFESPAICRTPVGLPDVIASVTPTVNGLHGLGFMDRVTGRPTGGLPGAGAGRLRAGSGYEPPNVPVRALPYLLATAADGTTRAEPPIGFLGSYDYHVIHVEGGGLSGTAELLGVRLVDPFASPDLHWVNLEIDHDPWPAAFELSVSWSCDPTAPAASARPSGGPSSSVPSASAGRSTQPAASSGDPSAPPTAFPPQTVKARIRILTSSDWSLVRISGARLTNAVRVAVRGESIDAAFDGTVFGMSHAIEAAQAGTMISMTWEVTVESVTSASILTVEIESSAIGTTTFILENALGSEPMPVRAIRWSGGFGVFREIARWPAAVLLERTP